MNERIYAWLMEHAIKQHMDQLLLEVAPLLGVMQYVGRGYMYLFMLDFASKATTDLDHNDLTTLLDLSQVVRDVLKERISMRDMAYIILKLKVLLICPQFCDRPSSVRQLLEKYLPKHDQNSGLGPVNGALACSVKQKATQLRIKFLQLSTATPAEREAYYKRCVAVFLPWIRRKLAAITCEIRKTMVPSVVEKVHAGEGIENAGVEIELLSELLTLHRDLSEGSLCQLAKYLQNEALGPTQGIFTQSQSSHTSDAQGDSSENDCFLVSKTKYHVPDVCLDVRDGALTTTDSSETSQSPPRTVIRKHVRKIQYEKSGSESEQKSSNRILSNGTEPEVVVTSPGVCDVALVAPDGGALVAPDGADDNVYVSELEQNGVSDGRVVKRLRSSRKLVGSVLSEPRTSTPHAPHGPHAPHTPHAQVGRGGPARTKHKLFSKTKKSVRPKPVSSRGRISSSADEVVERKRRRLSVNAKDKAKA